MKKIKLSFHSNSDHFVRQTPNFSGCWGNYQFFINEDIDFCDAWVVCEGLPQASETTHCPQANTIFISSESYQIWRYDQRFISQFNHVITCQRELQKLSPHVHYSLQGHGWHIGLYQDNPKGFGFAKSYDDLIAMSNIPKTKLLSIISSNKQDTLGHRQRYHFALALKAALGDQADIFGRGINDFRDKWEVLAPYKYSIAIENCSSADYVTEKLNDCFLAHSFPFYYGAPNVADYFSAASYETIDINDFAGSLQKIQTIITNPQHYQDHLAAVRAAKLKYLNHYQLFPLLAQFLDQHLSTDSSEKIILYNAAEGLGWNNYCRILSDKLTLFFRQDNWLQ